MKKKLKERVDKLIVERKLAATRAKAQALILEGKVFSSQQKIDKAGTLLPEDAPLEIRTDESEWVSRGAYKLLRALEVFPVDPKGKVCMDLGASTGGFTDVLLARGARRVYAVDVGYGQLAWKLRNDSRVVVMERTNARYLQREHFDEPLDMVTIDASFISLKLLLPVVDSLISKGGSIICLVKPQFEAGKDRLGKGGIVRKPEIHKDILTEVAFFIEEQTTLWLKGATWSPIKGPKGNIEFLFYLQKNGHGNSHAIDFDTLVEESHRTLIN
ncbi:MULTISPECIES: TlyA family RNA methyltransferase [Aminobacterium]|uniref:TlyA family RNA methyltransferase n=1 Tax=Aminobacterium TaxID=81466 RepID=UPI00257BE43F|nr:TlyA family RNA methyltransferase [Aminobacterium sp. UBA4987]